MFSSLQHKALFLIVYVSWVHARDKCMITASSLGDRLEGSNCTDAAGIPASSLITECSSCGQEPRAHQQLCYLKTKSDEQPVKDSG